MPRATRSRPKSLSERRVRRLHPDRGGDPPLGTNREHGLGADVDPMTGHLREPQFAAEDRTRLAHRDVDTGGRERARCDEPRQAPPTTTTCAGPGLGAPSTEQAGTVWSHAQHFVTS